MSGHRVLTEAEGSILPVMIGTAGHVDHGKTSLVRLLTGCETDTLKEEKKRGLTIDLGFAPCRFPGGRIAGIIDVPGHEDFIRNMVAGAASIDILLLVIAADDGVMPQTVEHLRIVSLLRSPKVLAVITKCDLVEPEMLTLVRADIEKFLAAAGFAQECVICCSNVTMEGISAVRTALRGLVDAAARTPDERAFRMNIERKFSVRGYGTVVTGIPVSGAAGIGDNLEIDGRSCQVRAVQSYKLEVEKAVAGACAAINLRDYPAEEIERGMTLYHPQAYRKTLGAIISIKNVDNAYTIKRLTEMRLHCGTFSANATVKLLGANELAPGENGYATLRLEQETVLAAGDRLILRTLSPRLTVAGGMVLSAEDYPPRRGWDELSRRLTQAREFAQAGDFTATALLAGARTVYNLEEISVIAQRSRENALPEFERVSATGIVRKLGSRGWLVMPRLAELINDIERITADFHTRNPYYWGLDAENLCALFNLPADAFTDLCRELTASGKFRINNNRLALPDFTPSLSKHQMALLENLRELVKTAGMKPYARGDLKNLLNACETDMKLITRLLVGEGEGVFIDNYLVAASSVEECRGILLDFLHKNGEISVSDWRGISGAARNFAVALLEYFDAAGLTRRENDVRMLKNL